MHVAVIPALAIAVGLRGWRVPAGAGRGVHGVRGDRMVTLSLCVARDVRPGASHPVAAVAGTALGFFGAAAMLAAKATGEALAPGILFHSQPHRADVVDAAAAVPLVVTGRVRNDATPTEFGAGFTLDVDGVRIDGQERATSGAVRVAVGGAFAGRRLAEWRAGRRVRVTATLSATLPYRNIGAPDQETCLMARSSRSRTRSVRKCYLCLRNELSPM